MQDPHASPPPQPEPRPGPDTAAAPRGMPLHDFFVRLTPRAWVTPSLAGLILAGFGLEVALGASPVSPTAAQLYAAGGDFGPAFLEGQWWRAFTAMFVHAGLLHLAFNLWAFLSVGKVIERIFGNWAFLAIYLLSGFAASLTSLAWRPLSVSVGASGAVFGVYGALLAFAMLHKGVVPPAYLAQQRKSLFGFIGFNVVFALAQKNVDVAAHGGGLVMGIVAGALLTRDLLAPRAHVARRVVAALGLAAVLGLAVFGVRERIASTPEVKARLLMDDGGDGE